jgi:hypothetical protein
MGAHGMSDHTIKIVNGHVQFVYDDALVDLLSEGTATVTRVSHVEPHDSGGWTANMLPALPPGPTPPMAEWLLGPFKTRAEALAAERAWLTKEKGL